MDDLITVANGGQNESSYNCNSLSVTRDVVNRGQNELSPHCSSLSVTRCWKMNLQHQSYPQIFYPVVNRGQNESSYQCRSLSVTRCWKMHLQHQLCPRVFYLVVNIWHNLIIVAASASPYAEKLFKNHLVLPRIFSQQKSEFEFYIGETILALNFKQRCRDVKMKSEHVTKPKA